MSECLPIKENISVYEGDDCTMHLTSQLGDLTGATIKLQARIDTSSRYAIIDVDGVITDAAKGEYSVTLPSSMTLGKGQDKAYYYDIRIKQTNNAIHTDRSGMFTVEPRTTDLNAPNVVTTSGVTVQKDGANIKQDAAHINFTDNMNVQIDGDGAEVKANTVDSGAYSAGTLTLTKTDGTSFDVSGWKDLSGVDFKDDGSTVGTFDTVDFKGSGVQTKDNQGTLEVTINTAASAPTLALHFAGIYETLQDLKDAVSVPTENMQAIVIQPSEKYYHGAGGAWVELAPVGAFHSKYLGVYDTVDDLKAAEPTPADESIAIIGTTAKSFYVYENNAWTQLAHTDLPSLDARVTDAESKIASLRSDSDDAKSRLTVAEGHLDDLRDEDTKIRKEVSDADAILQSNIDQKPDGLTLENADGTQLADLTSLKLNGAQIIDNGDGTYTLKSASQIDVADGQGIGSTSVTGNALIFEGSQVSVDPNDKNVIRIAVHAQTHEGINVGDGVNASRAVQTIKFPGHQAYGTGTEASIHIECLHFAHKDELTEWAAKFGSVMDFDSVAVVDDDGNGFVGWYKFDAATKTVKDYAAQGIVMSDSNGAIPKNIKTVIFGPGFTIQQAGDQEDAALVTYAGSSSGIDGITIDGHKVTEFDIGPNLQFDTGIGTGATPRMLVNPRSFEVQHAASCLLQLDSDITLQTGKETKLYTSHEVIPTGEYYSLNQAAGGVNVQDNTGGDTAVTGGELTRILGSVSFYGKASDAGNVKLWFEYKEPGNPLPASILEDVNGNPMVVERYYNQGDSLEFPLVVAGAMMATGQAPIVMKVEASAGSFVVNPDQTLICVEQFSDGYETSLASIEFQRRVGIESHAEIKQFSTTMLSLSDELSTAEPETSVPAHDGYDFLNEFGVQNLTKIKAAISNNHLIISDDGVIADFYIDAYLDNVKTSMLRGKTIDYDVTIKNPHDAYNLEVYKWTGKPDSAGRVYDSRNNDALALNDGFTLVKSKFIAEQPTGNATGVTDSVTVPTDAKNIFIILRPAVSQSPINLTLQEFKWGVPQPFRGYWETSRVNLNEQHLKYSENWAEFILTAHTIGAASLRYTINNTPSSGNPMPVGKLLKGAAPVEIDNTVNQVSGSADPQYDGGIKFLKDGEASISKSYNLWNEQGTDNTVTFWDVLIDADGNESKIDDSERTFTVPKNTGAPGVIYSIPAYVVQVETGQRVAGRATSNKADGVYVQSQNISQLLVQTEIDFKELVADSGDSPDLISAPLNKSLVADRRYHEFSGNSEQNIVITNFVIPDDVKLASVEAERATASGFTSIDDVQHSYNKSTSTMTVHVGAATSGVIYFDFWSAN